MPYGRASTSEAVSSNSIPRSARTSCLPHRVVAHDRLGRGYTYTLDVLSLQDDIELKQLIAHPVTLWINIRLRCANGISTFFRPLHDRSINLQGRYRYI